MKVYQSITQNETDCKGFIIPIDQEEQINEHTILNTERFIHDEKRKQNMLVKDKKRKNEERCNESLEENTIRLMKIKIRIIDDRNNKILEDNIFRLKKINIRIIDDRSNESLEKKYNQVEENKNKCY